MQLLSAELQHVISIPKVHEPHREPERSEGQRPVKVQFGAGVSFDPGKHYPLHEAAIEAWPRFSKLTLPPGFA
ncbi:MAG TPA: hypothetical protein VFV02_15340 [Acidimicrobiales bacterium]|nr:hypothetical protein [Acidimicrobiales bacterium]